jgi:DNA-binding PadR family transcriptional regulator
MEEEGWLKAEGELTEKNREARFYSLTAAGRKALVAEQSEWKAYVRAMSLALT